MKQTRDRRMPGILIVAAVLWAGVMVVPAQADGHGGKHSGHGHGVARGHYKSVPRYIAVDHRAYYAPYVSGRVYYAPHHHHHVRYVFPVYLNGGVVYQPYLYCGRQLFVSGAVTLPHLAIGVNYGSPGGVLVGGVYSSGYPYAPVYDDYDDRHEHHHHCDDDD